MPFGIPEEEPIPETKTFIRLVEDLLEEIANDPDLGTARYESFVPVAQRLGQLKHGSKRVEIVRTLPDVRIPCD